MCVISSFNFFPIAAFLVKAVDFSGTTRPFSSPFEGKRNNRPLVNKRPRLFEEIHPLNVSNYPLNISSEFGKKNFKMVAKQARKRLWVCCPFQGGLKKFSFSGTWYQIQLAGEHFQLVSTR